MSLKYKYAIFIILLHAILVGLTYHVLKDTIWYFIGSEILILFSLYCSYLLYIAFIKPVQLLQSGTNAIIDRDFSIKYVKTGSSDIDQLITVYNKMIQELREERILMTEQSYFINDLIRLTPMGVIIHDFDGKISNINPAARKLLSIDDDVSKNLSDYPSEIIPEIQKCQIGGSILISKNGIAKYKCQAEEVMHQGFKRKIILINDLSKELLQSEKKAYGQIIRMMAHEVNNSMGAINSIIDSVVEYGFADNEDEELKDSLIMAKNRNLSLGMFMAKYASILRLPKTDLKKMDLALFLKNLGKLFTPQAKENQIKITLDIPNEEIFIFGDKILLEQAISNIIKNAIESIGDLGEIKISCKAKPLSLTIADNGQGISPDIANKLFTPFFSTKTTGQGVGLMIIREVFQEHNTEFSLSTDPITGWTSFHAEFKK